jgi:nucleoside-triphosphatase
VPVEGFTPGEPRTGGRRDGCAVETTCGAQAVLAHVDLPGPPRVGRSGVDRPTVERVALRALRLRTMLATTVPIQVRAEALPETSRLPPGSDHRR